MFYQKRNENKNIYLCNLKKIKNNGRLYGEDRQRKSRT